MQTIRIATKKIIIILAAILLIFITSPQAFAKDEDDSVKGKNIFEIKVKDDTQKFEITGEITAVVGNNFVVSGQTIFIDPTHLRNFKQKGILGIGKRVKIEGLIDNGVKFAQEINVTGTGQGRFKFETADNPLSSSVVYIYRFCPC